MWLFWFVVIGRLPIAYLLVVCLAFWLFVVYYSVACLLVCLVSVCFVFFFGFRLVLFWFGLFVGFALCLLLLCDLLDYWLAFPVFCLLVVIWVFLSFCLLMLVGFICGLLWCVDGFGLWFLFNGLLIVLLVLLVLSLLVATLMIVWWWMVGLFVLLVPCCVGLFGNFVTLGVWIVLLIVLFLFVFDLCWVVFCLLLNTEVLGIIVG